MTVKEWEDKMLALPLAGKVSGEDEEHSATDPEYRTSSNPVLAAEHQRCLCDRCKIVRIKKRRTSSFPRSKCPACGELHVSIFETCNKCRKEEP